jgi:hypothetical protein
VLSATVDAASNRQLKNVPRHLLAVGTGIDLPAGIAAYARYSHVSGAFLDDDGAFPINGPSRLDVRAHRSVGRHNAFLDVLNLTNNRYEEYGFTLADFRGQAEPYVYAGASVAVRGGLTLKF